MHYALCTMHLSETLKRLRGRRGYGIHSPWAFNIVTQVIYNNEKYYNYEALDRIFRLRGKRRKVAQLLFRLVNDIQPDIIVVPHDMPEAEQAYMQAARKDATLVTAPREQAQVIRMGNGQCASDGCRPSQATLTIVLDLPHNRRQYAELVQDITASTFDLASMALIYHNKPSQHYIV